MQGSLLRTATLTTVHWRRQTLMQQLTICPAQGTQQQVQRRPLKEVHDHISNDCHARVNWVHEVLVPHKVSPVVPVPAAAVHGPPQWGDASRSGSQQKIV
jgi:hypothetical protein